ncbi:MAG: glycosyltransferase family 39 protein [Candidatus Eisenbacteria bacterium]|nr:glycosyltransferase family 39 protein [Candidatus Eisenbacteria bacterium]
MSRRAARAAAALVALLLLARLATLGLPPLFDATEGRYAEIGREMLGSGDWITPTLHGGEPFWAKPPLHFWMTALSLRAFGVNEWAARFPGFLSGLGILALTMIAARRLYGGRAALLAGSILGSSGLFALLVGTVILDVTFTCTVTGALVCYLLFRKDPSRRWPGLLLFLFLGLGLLAKGPIALVLAGLPVFFDVIRARKLGAVRRLPWVAGIGLLLLVAVPWYVLAERKTPGFWNYFFLHEHFLRYVRAEYGDRYGHGHVSPYGLIWALGLLGFLPWTPAAVGAAIRRFRPHATTGAGDPSEEEGTAFLWLWALSPLLFFTFSRSLSLPYVFPAFPPLAILLGREAAGEGGIPARRVGLAVPLFLLVAGTVYGLARFSGRPAEGAALLLPLLLAGGAALFAFRRGGSAAAILSGSLLFPLFLIALSVAVPGAVEEGKSTRHLARATAPLGGEPLFFDGVPPSAEFYFRGRAVNLRGEVGEILRRFEDGGGDLLLLREKQERYLSSTMIAALEPLRRTGDYVIYRIVGTPEREAATTAAERKEK